MAPVEMTELDKAKFWNKVDRSGGPDACWPWTGNNAGPQRGRYGIFDRRRDGKRLARRSHRVAYELTVGPIPDGLMLRHSCDNPPCCNPAHLIPGTAAENSADMVSRGRHWTQTRPERIPRGDDHWARRLGSGSYARGEAHHAARLTRGKVEEMRRRYAEGGHTYKTLADEYGVSKATVGEIIRGDIWTPC